MRHKVGRFALNTKYATQRREVMICYYGFCTSFNINYVSNCRDKPPNECGLKKRLDKGKRALKFVAHIENHLKDMDGDLKVCCKICNKTIDEIYKE